MTWPPTPVAVPELASEVAFEVDLLLDQFDLLERQIEAAEAHVASLLDGELARRLQTIPGVGPATCAVLIAEIGDIGALRYLRAAARLCRSSIRPSAARVARARTPRRAWRMSRAGNANLRARRLPDGRRSGGQHNPVIAAHYRGSARQARAR